MAEWLANLNKQEEGESYILKGSNICDGEGNCRHVQKMKSGMLDRGIHTDSAETSLATEKPR